MGLILLFIVSAESHCQGLIFTCLIILDIVPMQPGAPWSSTRKPALKLHLSREDLLFLVPCELQVNFWLRVSQHTQVVTITPKLVGY